MSRRPPNPAAERAAQNQQTIKSLLKLEANKICADCKRNKRMYSNDVAHQVAISLTLPSLQIHDGRVGTWVSLFAFAVQESTEEWELTSRELNLST